MLLFPLLTPHVDVRGASHVASGEHDEIQHVAENAQRADDWKDDAVGELAEVLGARILELLQAKKEEKTFQSDLIVSTLSGEDAQRYHCENRIKGIEKKRMTGQK